MPLRPERHFLPLRIFNKKKRHGWCIEFVDASFTNHGVKKDRICDPFYNQSFSIVTYQKQ